MFSSGFWLSDEKVIRCTLKLARLVTGFNLLKQVLFGNSKDAWDSVNQSVLNWFVTTAVEFSAKSSLHCRSIERMSPITVIPMSLKTSFVRSGKMSTDILLSGIVLHYDQASFFGILASSKNSSHDPTCSAIFSQIPVVFS